MGIAVAWPAAPQRPAPAELLAAAAADEQVATIPGVEAWSLAAPVRAGEVFALDDGRRLRAVRAWSPGPTLWRSPSRSRDEHGSWSRRATARRAELRRRQVRRRRVTGAVLLVAVAGIGIWAAATLASGGSAEGSVRRRPVTLTATSCDHGVTAATDGPCDDDQHARDDGSGPRPPTAPRSPGSATWWLRRSYGMPPDAGRLSMAPVVGPLRARRRHLREPRGDALGRLPESKCGRSRQLLRVPGPALVRQAHDGGRLRHHERREQPRRRLRRRPASARPSALCGRPGVRWTGRPGQITILRRKGLRVAFLGFAPYPWASRLEQMRVAQALVRKAARGPTSSSSRCTPAPRARAPRTSRTAPRRSWARTAATRVASRMRSSTPAPISWSARART